MIKILRRNFALITLACLMLMLIACGGVFDKDFYKSSWGDSLDTVKESDSSVEFNEIGGRLSCDREFLGYSCSVTYIFLDDELSEGDISISDEEGNLDTIFEDVSSQLISKYGEAKSQTDSMLMIETSDSIIMCSKNAAYVSVKFGVTLN